MPVIINGSTGISGTDGSAGTPAVQGTDGNTGMFFPAADQIAFSEGGVEAMRLDASGNVGIGVTTPAARLDVSASSQPVIRLTSTQDFVSGGAADPFGSLQFFTTDPSGVGARVVGNVQTIADTSSAAPGGVMVFSTAAINAAAIERARIDSSGNTYFGSNRAYATGAVTRIYGDGVSGYARIDLNKFSSGTFTTIGFFHRNTSVGVIDISDTGTSYVTSSDYRLKENVIPLTGAAARVQALKPSRFNFIADPARVVDGFIAHEAAEVVPEAVTGERDAVNEDGSIKPQGIDHSKLVPLLTAALQEALTEIAALKARVAALEATP